MRIAHINNIANVAWRLAEAQRRLGHEATVFSLQDTPFGFPSDVRMSGAQGPLSWNALMLSKWRTFAKYDVLHVHGGIWRSQLFYPLFKRRFRWKTLAVHFHGSETRGGRGLHHLAASDLQFHSTPDLQALLPNSEWIPNPIDLPSLPSPPNNLLPRFGHFASSPTLKGTGQVIETFRKAFGPLTTETRGSNSVFRGELAELWVVSGEPHVSALRIMQGCDAVIDQISSYGIYGMVAVEAMAYGKPVLSTFRADWFPGCPIIPLGSGSDFERLRELASDASLRKSFGQKGRVYVGGVHESGHVAQRILRAYYDAQQVPALNLVEARKYWLERGATYASEIGSPEVLPRYAKQSDELIGHLRDLRFQTTLEVGCGFGRIGLQLVNEFQTPWVGVDLSRSQLLEARRHAESLRSSLVEASAEALPFPDKSFDLVLAVEVLMHVPPERIDSVMKELRRVARKYVVHLDWFEGYLRGYHTGWCWVHDYPTIWKALGMEATEYQMSSTGIQRAFIVSKVS